jgi:hypothetical protein
MLTQNWQVDVFPALSVAWQVTVVLPKRKVEGTEGEHVAEAMPLPSVAVREGV